MTTYNDDGLNPSSVIQEMAQQRYQPTAGEQQMLGRYDNRMAELDQIGNAGGASFLADTTSAENAEKTARWAQEEQDQRARYLQQPGAMLRDRMYPDVRQPVTPVGAQRRRTKQNLVSPILDSVGVLGFAQGGKISGPGTATSDSIPAKSDAAGDIRVANGERIVSVEQDAVLERIAEMLGFPSVDAMFEGLTGKPVGPTLKGGQVAAADGAKLDPETLMQQVAARNPGVEYQAPAAPPVTQAAPASQAAPVDPQVANDRSALARGAALAADAVTLPGRAIADAVGAGGNAILRVANAAVGRKLADPYQSSIGTMGLTPFADMVSQSAQPRTGMARAPQQVAQAQYGNEGRSVPHPISVPASRPGAAIEAATPVDNTPAMPLTTRDIAPGGYIDRGNGILAQRGQNGQLTITNVGEEAARLADPKKRALDDSASALIDRKGSTYNPAAQLDRMQSLRLRSDALDPTITDPAVRQNAQQGLAILQAARQGQAQANALDASARLHNTQASAADQMLGLHKEYLDPTTTPDRRSELHGAIRALSGKEREPVNLQVTDVEEPIDPKQPLLGNRKIPYVFDPRTGQSRPMLQNAQANDPTAQARAAIARGADPKAVNARLKAMGLPEIQ